jgi:hypothetical protein
VLLFLAVADEASALVLLRANAPSIGTAARAAIPNLLVVLGNFFMMFVPPIVWYVAANRSERKSRRIVDADAPTINPQSPRLSPVGQRITVWSHLGTRMAQAARGSRLKAKPFLMRQNYTKTVLDCRLGFNRIGFKVA